MKFMRMFLLAGLLSLIPGILYAYPTVFPHGVTIYKPEKCWNGYTLLSKVVAKKPGGTVPEKYGIQLIDMNGKVVKEWKNVAGYPPMLLPGGRLLGGQPKAGTVGITVDTIAQYDFNGKIEWEWDKFTEARVKRGGKVEKIWSANQHHDIQREPNPVGYYVPGLDPYVNKGKTLLRVNHARVGESDHIIEVDWDGTVLWDFKGSEHINEMSAYNSWSKEKWWSGNTAAWLGPNKWYDSGDERFHPDNIIVDNYADTIGIISRKTGKMVWQVGPDFSKIPKLAKLGLDRKEFLGPHFGGYVGGMTHYPHMIPKGLPGEGNILVFKNGMPYSIVMEFNPVTYEVVWEYSGIELGYAESHGLSHKFFSPSVSMAQRLPNGNTMIVEGDGGRIFEVTRDLEIVWEYIHPVYDWGGLGGALVGFNQKKVKPGEGMANMVYRAYRYPYDYVPQLKKPVERSVTPPKLEDWRLPVDPVKKTKASKK